MNDTLTLDEQLDQWFSAIREMPDSAFFFVCGNCGPRCRHSRTVARPSEFAYAQARAFCRAMYAFDARTPTKIERNWDAGEGEGGLMLEYRGDLKDWKYFEVVVSNGPDPSGNESGAWFSSAGAEPPPFTACAFDPGEDDWIPTLLDWFRSTLSQRTIDPLP